MVGGSLRCVPRFLGTSRKRHASPAHGGAAGTGWRAQCGDRRVGGLCGRCRDFHANRPLLRDYGVVIMIADVAGIGFLRELGPC